MRETTCPLLQEVSALTAAFEARFGGTPRVFRAPGRVNLLGEHTDYNDGFVLPAAIGFAAWLAAGRRPDRRLAMHSEQYAETCKFDLDDPDPQPGGHWSDYVRGVAVTLQRAGLAVTGANLLLRSDVPVGAGLSSSAALEVAAALALTPQAVEPTAIAKLCRRAENEFAGVPCGIMDQFVACHAQAGRALLLDCRSLDYRFAPIPAGVKLVIVNSMVRHSLAAGEYGRRHRECAQAAAYFGKSLRDVTTAELRRASLPPEIFRRARHVITENARVLRAHAALEGGDVPVFGELMYESHRSLRDDFEVSCAELDALVEIARGVRGVYGSRMTGGGFGGCTVSLVAGEHVQALRSAIAAGYPSAEIYVSDAASGASELEISR